MRRLVMSFATAIMVMPLAASAQGGRDSAMQGGEPVRRQQMEARLQRGVWRIAKERIQLSDDQMTRLEQTASRFDVRRRSLNKDERSQRQALRTEIGSGDRADQERVATALDRLAQLQRQRLDLMGEEQKELATFMTPVQRAKFAALQEHLRRRVAMMRARRNGDLGPP